MDDILNTERQKANERISSGVTADTQLEQRNTHFWSPSGFSGDPVRYP